jgi:hypothetical protein
MASAHLDQHLTPPESIQFQAHVEVCAGCRTYLADLEQVSLTLKGAGRIDALPELRGRITSVIAGESAAHPVLFDSPPAAEKAVRFVHFSAFMLFHPGMSRPKGVSMSIQDKVLRLKAVSSSSYTRTAAFIGITLAVLGPFMLVATGGREANNMPWYVWTSIPLLLLLVIAVGFLVFNRRKPNSEGLSISPRHQ